MSALRIDVADLLTHPSARREVRLEAPLEEATPGAATLDGPLSLDLTLERISDGIVVRGWIRSTWTALCSTCLREVQRPLEVHIDELFEPEPVEGETYPLDGHEIDLEQLARDAVLLELPLAPHCGEDDCEPAVPTDTDTEPDPRWAALSELEL